MAYLRGPTYIWHGEDGVHVWGRPDDSFKDTGWGMGNPDGRGIIIPDDEWELFIKNLTNSHD